MLSTSVVIATAISQGFAGVKYPARLVVAFRWTNFEVWGVEFTGDDGSTHGEYFASEHEAREHFALWVI